jgi:uncharacterized OB-fold protein
MSDVLEDFVAAVPYVVLGSGNDHYLSGSRCGHCGTTLLGERIGCAKCGASDSITRVRLADTGRVRTCTVITRSYPGVPVPFIAAVIDIDGGGVVRGTLQGPIPANPVELIGTPVHIRIEDTGQRDASGRAFFSHNFHPAEFSA